MTTRTDNIRFIIKITDKKEGDWGYIWNGCTNIMGKNGFFTEDDTFASVEEAEAHIKTVLNSGWFRSDVTRDYFEIIPVRQYEELCIGFFWYTEDYYNKVKSLH